MKVRMFAGMGPNLFFTAREFNSLPRHVFISLWLRDMTTQPGRASHFHLRSSIKPLLYLLIAVTDDNSD